MKLDALDHPKTHHFASLLDVSRPTVIGHLELLWAFTGKNAPQGNIGKWPNGAIARACDWMGDPDKFVAALIGAKLADADPQHRVIVHDWHEHAPGWVRAKLKGLKLAFVSLTPGESPASATLLYGQPGSSPPGSTPSSTPSILVKRSVVKGSVVKGIGGGADPGGEPTPELTPDLIPEGEPPDPNETVERIRTVYPAGHYRDSAWLKAAHFVALRLDEGVMPDELVAAAVAYAEQQAARGKVGTEFVLSPAKFFESEWRGPFPLPSAGDDSRIAGNVAAAREFLAGGAT